MNDAAPIFERAEDLYRRLQDAICADLEAIDGQATFHEDPWERPGGGGGRTRVLSDGPIIEKAAVNWSSVGGDAPPQLAEHLGDGASVFRATGISLIVHPRNPYAPTMHANLRIFEAGAAPDQMDRRWFGGGVDLTPYYLFADDVRHFHRTVADVCMRHPVADHDAWKRWCDEYFFLPHRGEHRGVGGIFFDRIEGADEAMLAFQDDLGAHLMAAYLPLVERRSAMPYGEREERWHLQRRGRYVEFNLVWDRGTRFGLQTRGRTESILASLPPRARWDYAAEPEPGTAEHELLELLRGEPRDWT